MSTTEVQLPATLKEAYRFELRRALKSPYEIPTVVVVNGILMSVLWFWVPSQSLFTLHVSWAFPLVLASWMYSDVPATNVLGSDAQRALAALDDPDSMHRILYAKNLMLMTLVVPVTTVVALSTARDLKTFAVGVINIIWIVVVPLGAIAVSAWFGVYWPYHPIAMKERWERRREFWHMWARWIIVVTMPYVIVPAASVILSLPALIWWKVSGGGKDPSDQTNLWPMVAGVALTCVISLVMWFVGHRITLRLIARRRDTLHAYLSDPHNG